MGQAAKAGREAKAMKPGDDYHDVTVDAGAALPPPPIA
jgi:hypothetical protein